MQALHDYECPACGALAIDVPIDMALGARAVPVYCTVCEVADVFVSRMEWIPKVGRMSAGNGPTFRKFDVLGPDNKTIHTIDSISALRKLEAESEQRARDGTGQIMVWRDFSNDRTNKYDSAIPATWSAPGLPARAGNWHDHPTLPPPGQRPTFRVGEDVAKQTRGEFE